MAVRRSARHSIARADVGTLPCPETGERPLKPDGIVSVQRPFSGIHPLFSFEPLFVFHRIL